MMEVDMQSPPSTFRPVPLTVKRPRSPGSPSQERQTKRLSLAPGHATRRTSTASHGEGRMSSQDDWVQQARELSIASPLSVTAGFSLTMDGGATVAQTRVDEHMAVDDEESQVLRVHVHPGISPRPWRSHLPSIHITTTSAPPTLSVPNELHVSSPAPYSVLTEPPSSSSDSASSTSSISISVTQTGVCASTPHLRPPDIFLFPATPSDTASHEHQFETEYGPQSQESAPEPHSARMPEHGVSQSLLTRTPHRRDGSGSPRPSKTPDVPTSSGRKHRVTMGPRADCMKCRTGVRGHWMHFD